LNSRNIPLLLTEELLGRWSSWWPVSVLAMARRADGNASPVARVSISYVFGGDVAEQLQLVQPDLGRIMQVVSGSALRTRKGFCVTQQASVWSEYLSANCYGAKQDTIILQICSKQV